MFRKEASEAQRRESMLMLMEGEQGEDGTHCGGRAPDWTGGSVCVSRGHIHGKLGDSGICSALSVDLVPQSTACARSLCLLSLWKAALLPRFLPAYSSARLQICFLAAAPKYHSLLNQGGPRL